MSVLLIPIAPLSRTKSRLRDCFSAQQLRDLTIAMFKDLATKLEKVDIYDQNDTIRVIAEVPGVPKEHIKVRTEVQRIRITASEGERMYSKVIDLPCEIIPESAQAKYNYGVLEITLKKIGSSEDKSGVDVQVE